MTYDLIELYCFKTLVARSSEFAFRVEIALSFPHISIFRIYFLFTSMEVASHVFTLVFVSFI